MRHKKLTLKEKQERRIKTPADGLTQAERLLGGSSFHRKLNDERQEKERLEQERVEKKRAKAARYKSLSPSRLRYLEKKGITLEQYHSNNNRRKDKKK